jgi:parvulin-like peptidyl-prolyl isomerase
MSPEERQQLVDSYVREEAMARQARAMGLDDVDYVIRQRLIQKILFLIDEASAEDAQPDEADLQAYFEANQELYRQASTVTFTHVFIDDEKTYAGGGEAEAQRVQARLAARNAGFNDATRFGDRFPYLQNYVGRSGEFIANQFGPDFSRSLMALEPSNSWQGPIRSEFGWHLVLLTQKAAAEMPTLADVRGQVLSDYVTERLSELRAESLDDLIDTFNVEIDLPAGALPSPAQD